MTLTKPVRPHRSMFDSAKNMCMYAHFTPKQFDDKFDLNDNWPCWKCAGKGFNNVYSGVGNDSYDQNCYYCQYTGVVTRDRFKEWFNNEMEGYKRRLLNYRHETRMIRRIKAKLTKDEFEFISRY